MCRRWGHPWHPWPWPDAVAATAPVVDRSCTHSTDLSYIHVGPPLPPSSLLGSGETTCPSTAMCYAPMNEVSNSTVILAVDQYDNSTNVTTFAFVVSGLPGWHGAMQAPGGWLGCCDWLADPLQRAALDHDLVHNP